MFKLNLKLLPLKPFLQTSHLAKRDSDSCCPTNFCNLSQLYVCAFLLQFWSQFVERYESMFYVDHFIASERMDIHG